MVTMKTRVLMFGWEFPPFNSGGLGVACLGLTRALSSLGMEIIFVMPKKLDIRAPWARILFGDNVIESFNSPLTAYITSKSYGSDGAGHALYGSDLFTEVERYGEFGRRMAKEEQFDVIYAHDWLSFKAGLAAQHVSRKPLVVHIHATEFDRTGGSSINQSVYDIEKEAMEKADAVVAVSEFTKSIITEKYGIPAEKISVVYNGIDETTAPERLEEVTRLRALKRSGQRIVLFLGRITLQKGPDYFLRTAQRVLEHDKDVLFVVSGSGDLEAGMMAFAGGLGIAQNVFFN